MHCSENRSILTHRDGQCYFFDPIQQQYRPCSAIGNPQAPTKGSAFEPSPSVALVPHACGRLAESVPVAVPKPKKKGKVNTVGIKKASQDMAAWSQSAQDIDAVAQQGQPLAGQPPNGLGDFKFEITNFNPDPPKKKKKEKVALNGGEAIATPIQFDPKLLGANPETRSDQALPSKQPSPGSQTEKLPPAPSAKAAPASFVCLLCQRKFKSQEMLTQHEAKSELHKANLKKKLEGKL